MSIDKKKNKKKKIKKKKNPPEVQVERILNRPTAGHSQSEAKYPTDCRKGSWFGKFTKVSFEEEGKPLQRACRKSVLYMCSRV